MDLTVENGSLVDSFAPGGVARSNPREVVRKRAPGDRERSRDAVHDCVGRMGRKARSVLTAEPAHLLRVPWPDGVLDVDSDDDL